MAVIKKIIISFVLLCMMAGFCGCGSTNEATETEDNIFRSNKTAADYLEGYWTDSKGNYLIAQSTTDNVMIYYAFSMPTKEDATMYLLENGTLLAAHITEDNVNVKEAIMTFEYVDENTFKAASLINGETYTLSRDSFDPDEESLDDEYVFKTISHASKFMNGNWTDSDDNFITFTVDDDGNVGWSTNLAFPECDYIDFYDGDFVGVTTKEDDEKEISPALKFTIIDKNHIMVKSLTEDYEAEFLREDSPDISVDEYAFWNVSHTVSYLNGRWENEEGKYFEVEMEEDGKIQWSTNIAGGKYKEYNFGKGCIYAMDSNDEKKTVFQFESNGMDEMKLTEGDNTYILNRIDKDEE